MSGDLGQDVKDYSGVGFNAFANFFGFGEMWDPVGRLSKELGEIQALTQAFLNESNYQLFQVNLAVLKKTVNLSDVVRQQLEEFTLYYYNVLDGKYKVVQVFIPLLTVYDVSCHFFFIFNINFIKYNYIINARKSK